MLVSIVNYGFLIDNRSCIGCHACSTACKSENQVPLGVYRTWVKYTETGSYPDTQRHFQVTRCNHCANPPCVRICPTGAMYQREDGIVEFNKDACIGCKACMQACPYDAIHIDPDSKTAAKCHFCAHRTELGLAPACEVVCPTEAIISGDLDDPSSKIAQMISREKVSVRKPEQGTAPKLFYIEGSAVNLVPTATEREPETFVWADVVPQTAGPTSSKRRLPILAEPAGGKPAERNRAPQPQGLPEAGPIQVGGRRAAQMVQVGYNAQHKVPWHWPVPAYLLTKGIATGIFGLLAFFFGLGLIPFHAPTAMVGGGISVAMMLATTALLVYDLEKPTRFLYILTRPQWRSWLTRGAVFLIAFSTIGGLWWALETGAYLHLLPEELARGLRPFLLLLGLPFALGAAIYTAFLFGQAEGRDLWQSPLLPFHLVVQAVMMGAATLLLMSAVVRMPAELLRPTLLIFFLSLTLDLFLLLFGEVGMSHASEVAAKAAERITKGPYKRQFWGGAIVLGHLIPLALLFTAFMGRYAGSLRLAPALAGLAAIVGLYLYEHAFVMAPQEIPNS